MYRLYIDETGNADLKASQTDPNHRFLSLTGVILHIDYTRTTAHPALEELKATFFGHHPDEPIILHRKDLVQRNRPFHALRDPTTEQAFNDSLLGYLGRIDFKAITTVIDKLEHLTRYQVWRYDPYHYCLQILMERYVYFLRDRNASGDAMAEVRGRKPDERLQNVYKYIYRNGTGYVRAAEFQRYLSSHTLKMRPKSANVTGLQISDLLAFPSAQYVRSVYNREPAPERFGGQLLELLLDRKYQRDARGTLNGFGIKWLP